MEYNIVSHINDPYEFKDLLNSDCPKTHVGRKIAQMQGVRARRDAYAYIMKPECTNVHETTLIIWQDFEATQQMGEFSF